jgi:hypothetical protein
MRTFLMFLGGLVLGTVPHLAYAQPTPAPPSVTLQWDHPTDTPTQGFQLFRCQASVVSTDCAPSAQAAILWNATARQWIDTGVKAGGRYCWKMRAVRQVGEPSPMGNTACATIPEAVAPPTPTPIPEPTPPTPEATLVAPTNLRVAP